jgi:DNA-binding beta-propeller fold protein YncE
MVLLLAACGQTTAAPPAVVRSASPVAATTATHSTATSVVMAVVLPDGIGGIGFDDLRYDATLGQVLAPAGRTGNLDLIDPQTQTVTPIGGFSAQASFGGGHDDGPTSADSGHGLIFVTDRTTQRLQVIDPATRTIVASVALESSPDYVRYVAPTGELWVTEPDQEQIEVFTLPDAQQPMPERAAVIVVKGGPESLVIDPQRQRAYTHLWAGATVAIDLNNRTLVAQWPNGCDGSRGIALDERRGWLFAGCAEGVGIVLDVDHDGQQLSNIRVGAGVDVIDYNPTLAHLYLPGATSATMEIAGVSASGTLSLLGTIATARDAHCVAADTHGTAWVCDPYHGQLLRITDPFPAAGT